MSIFPSTTTSGWTTGVLTGGVPGVSDTLWTQPSTSVVPTPPTAPAAISETKQVALELAMQWAREQGTIVLVKELLNCADAFERYLTGQPRDIKTEKESRADVFGND